MRFARTGRPLHLSFWFLVMAFVLGQWPSSAFSLPFARELKIESPSIKDKLKLEALKTEMEADLLVNQNRTPEEKRLAIAKYEAALGSWRELGDRRNEARLMGQIGALYRVLGDLHSTFNYHSRARQIWQDLGERERAANMTISIGMIQRRWGQYQLALEGLNKAKDILASLANREGEGQAIQELGSVYLALGETQLALAYFNQALKSYTSVGNRLLQCSALNALGVARESLGEKQSALGYFQQVLEIAHGQEYELVEGVALRGLGGIYLAQGEREKAAECYHRLLTLGRSVDDARCIVEGLYALGRLSFLAGDPEKALDYLSQALPLYQRMGVRQGEAQTLSQLARVKYSLGDLNEARRLIEAALRIKESMRINVSRQDLKASFFGYAQDDFDLYIDLLMSLHRREPAAGYDALALGASERGRARCLLEELAEIELDPEQGIDPQLRESARRLRQQLNAKAAARFIDLSDRKETKADYDRQLAELTSQYQEVEARIRASNPRFATLTRTEPLTLTEIQRLLDDQTVLLEFALGQERSWLWAVTPRALISRQLPARSELETASRAVYRLLTARQPQAGVPEQPGLIAEADAEYQATAQDLSDKLLGPIAASLRGEWKGKRLLIAADGALQYLPFGALPVPVSSSPHSTDPAFLISEHEVVNLPSASVLEVIRRETADRLPARKTLAVLADPVFDRTDPRLSRMSQGKIARRSPALKRGSAEGFGRLPFSADEADAIASFVPASSLLKATAFQASREKVLSGELADYRLIHFATHGLLNSEHPELSGLVLSLVDEHGQPRDGFLRVNEIYNLRLPAETVVLSACQTALGKEIKGEGLVGLTRGFMYAGAQRVVASLWEVDDLATAALMAEFYRSMLNQGRRPAAALRAAQLELMKQKRWAPPYFWAGFTIQGEWK